jgi:hypothetical protein
MMDMKPLASLSSGLLARKGHAKPAMRPQAISLDQSNFDALEDLGWNDMGHEDAPVSAPIALTPYAQKAAKPAEVVVSVEVTAPLEVANPVAEQQDRIIRELVPEAALAEIKVKKPAPVKRSALATKGRAAFTLRLDEERHLKLRLLCAVEHRSAQQVVTQALDEFLASKPELEGLAAQSRS